LRQSPGQFLTELPLFLVEERFCSRLLDSDGAKKALRSQPYQMIYSADVKILTGETECDSYRLLSMDKGKNLGRMEFSERTGCRGKA
jgi:hypothetical protein